MITTQGKQIIAKYLLGQAPEFSAYLAAGCGNVPFNQSSATTPLYSGSRKNLDFEAFRVPILSKGFVTESGQEKIVFKAEMPSDQRYQITEVGVFPAAGNSIANQYDSKLLATFSPAESWLYGILSASATTASAVPEVTALNSSTGSDIDATDRIFYFYSGDRIFNDAGRKGKQEPPRFLSKAVMVRGDNSNYYIENSTFNFDLSQNLPSDKIRLAISLITKTAASQTSPTSVSLVLDFINNVGSKPKARYSTTLASGDFVVPITSGTAPSKYKVLDIPLGSFTKDADFSWGQVNLVRITAYVTTGDATSDQYYVCLDGMRLENESTDNPLYSLVGYDVAKTTNGYPITKIENTSNYIEYRFGVEVS